MNNNQFQNIKYLPKTNHITAPFFFKFLIKFFSYKSFCKIINLFKNIYFYFNYSIESFFFLKKKILYKFFFQKKIIYKQNYLSNNNLTQDLKILIDDGIIIYENFFDKRLIEQIYTECDYFFKNMEINPYGYEKEIFPGSFFLNYDQASSFLPNISLNKPLLKLKLLPTICLNEKILNLVSNYLAGDIFLSEPFVLRSFPSTDLEQKEASNWHKDNISEKKFLQIFIYLDDVDENSGAFYYQKKSHGNTLKSFKVLNNYEKNFLENFGRITDDSLYEIYDKKNTQKCHFKKGTVIIADTTGFHRGPVWDYNKKFENLKSRTLINLTFSEFERNKKINNQFIPSEYVSNLNDFQKSFIKNYQII